MDEPTQMPENPICIRKVVFRSAPRQDLQYYFMVIFRFICITQPFNNRMESVANFSANICTAPSLI